MHALGALRGQPVMVGLAGGPTPNPFVVDSAIDDTAVLRPTTGAGKTFAAMLQIGDQLTVGAPARDRFMCADVIVQRWTADKRLLLVSNPPVLHQLQRRTFKRVAMSFAVELAVVRDGGLERRLGDGSDLSLGGFAATLRCPPVQLGELAAVMLRLNDEQLLTVAEVIDAAAAGRNESTVRMRFTQLHSSQRPALAMALHEAELARVRVDEGVT